MDLKWLEYIYDKLHTQVTKTVMQTPRWLLIPGLTVGVGLVTAIGYFYTKPERFLSFMQRLQVFTAGLSVKSVQGERFTYAYLERGTRKQNQLSMLFIHGFISCKEDWAVLIKHLPKDVHIICVDLLGHGETTLPTHTEDVSISKLVDSVHEFVHLVGLDKVSLHLIGTSMGGVISALYTVRHPEHIGRLTLLCPAICSPIQTKMWHLPNQTFFTNDVMQFRENMNSYFYNKDVMPKAQWIYKVLMEKGQKKQNFYGPLALSLKNVVQTNRKKFESDLAKIKIPVQIIWGEQDECVHVSGASLLETVIPSVKRTDILPYCGHVIFREQPEVTKSLIMDFYNTTYEMSAHFSPTR